jgi:transmembrane sensor
MSAIDPMIPDREPLTDERLTELERLIATDPDAALRLKTWLAVKRQVRKDLAPFFEDRRPLVLAALESTSVPLTEEERLAAAEFRSKLEVSEGQSALDDIVGRIQAEAGDFEAAWDRHFAKPAAAPARPPRSTGRRIYRIFWRTSVAAAIIVLAIILTLVPERDRHMIVLSTQAGETAGVELADGTVIRLMERSRLSYPDPATAPADRRTVRLTGSALFDVVPGGRGLVVETAEARTTVLGTRFGVRSAHDATEVTLISGAVAVSARRVTDGLVRLEPGQQTVVHRAEAPRTPEPVDLLEAFVWAGLLIFRAETMERVAERLEAVHDAEIVVHPDLRGQHVTGTFDVDQPLEDVLAALAATLGATVERHEDAYHLLSR